VILKFYTNSDIVSETTWPTYRSLMTDNTQHNMRYIHTVLCSPSYMYIFRLAYTLQHFDAVVGRPEGHLDQSAKNRSEKLVK